MGFIVTPPPAESNQSFKEACRAATTANISLTGLQTVDGVSLQVGDRVLVKNQATGSQNGIYVVSSSSWSRAADADAASDLPPGCIVTVSEGTVNGDLSYILTTNAPITLDVTALTFAVTAVVDHGMLTGLADDDHAQYFKVTGRTNEALNMAGDILFSSDGVKSIGASLANRPLSVFAKSSVGTAQSAVNMGAVESGNVVSDYSRIFLGDSSGATQGNIQLTYWKSNGVYKDQFLSFQDAGGAGQFIGRSEGETALTFGKLVGYSPTSLFQIDTSGNLKWITDNTADIGASGTARPRTIYVGTSILVGNGSAASPSMSFGADTDTGFYRVGANQVGVASNGRLIAYLEDNAGPGVVLNPDATNLSSYIYQNLNTAMLSISAGSGSGSGRNIQMFGGTHATQASVFNVRAGTTTQLSISSAGAITLGATGGSQSHIINGHLAWNTDGGGDIGSAAANRPNQVNVKDRVNTNNGKNILGDIGALYGYGTGDRYGLFISHGGATNQFLPQILLRNSNANQNWSLLTLVDGSFAFTDETGSLGNSGALAKWDKTTKNLELAALNSTGAVQFYRGTTATVKIDSSSNLSWNTDGAGSIGTSGVNRPKYVHVKEALQMERIAAASVPNAAANSYYLFFDSSNGDKLSKKDSAGTVTVIGTEA